MKKYDKGDKVVWMGKHPEMFDGDLIVGQVYTVMSHEMPGDGLGVSQPSGDLYVTDDDGKGLTYMRGDNFLPYDGEPVPRYNNGDIVVVTSRNQGAEFKEIPTVCKLSQKTSYDYLATNIDDPDESWYVGDDQLEPYTKQDENGSQLETGKLKLSEATFHNKSGSNVTVKRSACRHYYIKYPGKKQQRVTKAQVKDLLVNAAATL